VAVVVGELGVRQPRVQLRDPLQELDVGPLAAGRRAFGVAVEHGAHLGVIGVLLLSGHMCGASDS
jgi:hypothetical protein